MYQTLHIIFCVVEIPAHTTIGFPIKSMYWDINSKQPQHPSYICPSQCPERFLGITNRYPSVFKSNRLHVDIFRYPFINLGYILYIPLKWSVIFVQSPTSTGQFSNSTGSYVTNCRFFSPIIGPSRLQWRRPKTYTITQDNGSTLTTQSCKIGGCATSYILHTLAFGTYL